VLLSRCFVAGRAAGGKLETADGTFVFFADDGTGWSKKSGRYWWWVAEVEGVGWGVSVLGCGGGDCIGTVVES